MDFFPRLIKEEHEERLSEFATKSKASAGRLNYEEPCSVRTAFERDTGRIIFSMPFRRLRHKTQVFFSAKNDHICTRMEHVIYVKYIATTIGRALNLNGDLIEAIALGHDLGHAPFGHSGERKLNQCIQKIDDSFVFQHELNSLRVIDYFAEKSDGLGLNLTFEVRDGIVSHCGEIYDERIIEPLRGKKKEELVAGAKKHLAPATLEGCVVRMADKIAYVGRDIEDAVRAGIMDFKDLPAAILSKLGKTNSQMINTLVMDIVENSQGKDAIIMSAECSASMENLLKENTKRIYRSEKINRYEVHVDNIIEGLFEAFISAIEDEEKLAQSNVPYLKSFNEFLTRYPLKDEKKYRKVVDYIAGMTDHYATEIFEKIYWL